MNIQIFATGGTIAKKYDEISGKLVFDDELPQKILKQARSTEKFDIQTLMLKDSLEMDEIDREIILQSVNSTNLNKIVILHGTDTMIETARKLSKIKGKTVVLTGAMIPFSFKNSDALFNVGLAIGALSGLSKGVYIAMNSRLFTYDNVKKDKNRAVFDYLRT